MGSAASLEALPDTLTLYQVQTLCGASFNENEFKHIAQGGNSISKDDFLAALHNKTDVFLTHDWGKELGQDNHARVGEINRRLQARGLTTWFDSEQMEGNVKKQMALGIDNAQCIIAFITKRYIDKVGGFNAEDNCQLEFNYAARRKTASRMIPVVMEERVRNTGTWDGEVGLVLGGRLYVDMCGDTYEDEYIEHCVDDLYSKIIKIIKNPIKGLNSGETTQVTSFAETMPTQVRPSPKKEKKNVKPLTELTVEDVGKLLEANKLGKFVEEMKDNDVDGATLMETNSDEELKELGISLAVKARMFYKKLEEYKFHGVPFSLLGIPEQKDEVVENVEGRKSVAPKPIIKYGDGTFTIAGATGSCIKRINGSFEISEDMQNGVPVYAKVGDADTFIELVNGASGWRWYLKTAKDKGPTSSVCFAYMQCNDEDMKLPSQSDYTLWHIHATEGFDVQSTVTITPSSDLPLPANITQLLNQARETIKTAKLELIAEETRNPLPGAFRIVGATGKSEVRINGTFEPTKETQNGFPVYKKKGDKDSWIEMVYKPSTGWRWYLKPTANKGPDSSICFAYVQCVETDMKLPQDCPDWLISTAEGFVKQSSCVVSLAINVALPSDVSSRFKEGIIVVKNKMNERLAEETRGVIAGTFRLSGATGKSEGRFNGVFEPTSESQNSFPVYKKKGDSDSWIELVNGASGWRWYLKPTANKGPDSSICFAYLQCDVGDMKLPSESTSAWNVHTASGFVAQPTTMTLESDLPLPANLVALVKEGKAMMKKALADKAIEENRDAAAGSFRIDGATGKSYVRINGTFEPTSESQNGFPVYKKKGDDQDTYVEIVFKAASGWRWYLKPVANRGPDSSICFAYAQCDGNNIKLPGDETKWNISTNDGFVAQTTVKITRPGASDPSDVLTRYREGLALALKAQEDRKAEEARGALQGSFRLDGAVGKSANRTNGVFEPTKEVQNGMPVYQKKGDPDSWIELVHGASGWRWYLKPTANKGPDSTICFSYYSHDGKDCKVPIDCKKDWFTNTDDGFKAQSSIKTTAVGDAGQPAHVEKLQKAAAWKTLH